MHDQHHLFAAMTQGDALAAAAMEDMREEGQMESPFEEGQSYLVCLNTLYYLGRVTKVRLGWIRMDGASWVHWTGRLSTLMSRQSLAVKGWPEGHRRPRTEFVGPVFLFVGTNGAAAYPWTGELPTESITR